MYSVRWKHGLSVTILKDWNWFNLKWLDNNAFASTAAWEKQKLKRHNQAADLNQGTIEVIDVFSMNILWSHFKNLKLKMKWTVN